MYLGRKSLETMSWRPRSWFVLSIVSVCALGGLPRAHAQEPAADAGLPPPLGGDAEMPRNAQDAGLTEPSARAPEGVLPPAVELDAARPIDPFLSQPFADAGAVNVPELVIVTTPAASPPEPMLSDDDMYGASAVVQRPAGPGEFAPAGTGSKVNAPLEELAATVNTVDAKQMRERGSVDLSSALTLVPGVVPQWSYGGFLYIQSRGFQAATLYDGHRDPRAMIAQSAPQPGIFDLDRAELLKGPSSVLYGYGAVGGSVNLIRKRASAVPAYEVELGVGTPGQYRIHGAAQGAISKDLSYRTDVGAISYENFRGYKSQRAQFATTLRYTPTRKNTLNVRAAYSTDHYNTDVGIPTIEDPARPGHWVLPPGTRYSARYNTKNDFLKYQRMEAAADYRYELNRATYFEARGSIVQDHYSYLAAESLSYVPPAGGNRAQVERGYLYFARGWRPIYGTAELHSDVKTGSVSHQLVLGYGIESFTGISDRSNSDDATANTVDFAYPLDTSGPVANPTTSKDHYRIATHSVYGFDHIKLTEALILTGGVRFDMLRTRTRRQFLDRDGNTVPDPKSGEFRSANLKSDFRTTGQVGLVANLWKPVIAYASYGSAFLPQFVYPSQLTPTNYRPETSQMFEGGLRLRVDEQRHVFKVDAAGYLIRKRNLLVPLGPDSNVTAGLAQSRGLDLSVHYSAPRYVQLDAGYAFVDAKYLKYQGFDAVSGDMRSFSGNALQFAYRHSGNVWLRGLLSERFHLGVGSRIVGKAWADDQNRYQMPSYALLDASATYGNEHASITLVANNLTGRTGYINSAINSSNPQVQVTPGPGREILGMLRLAL
ncbi:MAG: TonB-dependent siderophore receptor [Myxococcaceae bacterium]|nr:TonB-dependent siderophore receptor [Myxococcaceae bacterium]